ncbi:hypothetical protein Tco_0792709 [Tanacetum coccineum]
METLINDFEPWVYRNKWESFVIFASEWEVKEGLNESRTCFIWKVIVTEMSFRNFIYTEYDDDLAFSLKSHTRFGLPDCFELKDANVVVDNVVNKRARKFLQVIKKMSGEADVIKARERSCEEECEELRVKCEAAMAEFDQNPAVLAL